MPKSGNLSVLLVSAWAFATCIAVWAMFAVAGIPIRSWFNLNSTQLGRLMVTPVGSLMVLGLAFACGMASTFKYIGDDLSENMGAVSAIVGMVGGVGGALLPIMFGAIVAALGERELLHAALRHHLGVADTQLRDRGAAYVVHGRVNGRNPGRCVTVGRGGAME